MKTFLALILIGNAATFYFLNQEPALKPENEKIIAYNEVNQDIVNQLSDLIVRAKDQPAGKKEIQAPSRITGNAEHQQAISDIFAYMKSNQVLYRYEMTNQLKSLEAKLQEATVANAEVLNQQVNHALEMHQSKISQLKSFSAELKNNLQQRLEKMKNPLKIETKSIVIDQAPKAFPYQEALNLVPHLSQAREMRMSAPQVIVARKAYWPIMLIWSGLCVAGIFMMRSRRPKVQAVAADEQINPTVKRILTELDYPLIMVDQSFNVIWKNKKTEDMDLSLYNLQGIFATKNSDEKDFRIGKDTYQIEISELAYKSGKTNFLAQLKPAQASSRHLEHLLNQTEVASYLDTHQSGNGYGDVNQSVANLAVKLGYLFKVSGKFMDVQFGKSLSDCFIESNRLEGMLKEFFMGCHHMVKDTDDVSGLYVSINEVGNRFQVNCFLMNYRAENLESHPLSRDFLRRFSILESRYAICNPVIEFRDRISADVKGLEVCLYFENKSELENFLPTASANA